MHHLVSGEFSLEELNQWEALPVGEIFAVDPMAAEVMACVSAQTAVTPSDRQSIEPSMATWRAEALLAWFFQQNPNTYRGDEIPSL